MSNQISVNVSVKADVKKVWNMYTDPVHIVNWNFADQSWHCPKAENNMKVGGMYFARMEAKDGSFGFDFIATYTEIIEGKSFTYEFDKRKSKVEFIDQLDATKIIVAFDPEEENPILLQKNGWQSILNNFKSYVESN